MSDFFSSALTLIGAKILTILASFSMALISVGIDSKKYTLPSAIMAIFAGTVVGVIAASSITALMGWSESVGYGIASIFAISAQNLIKWILRSSQDPITLWQRIRGVKDDDRKAG